MMKQKEYLTASEVATEFFGDTVAACTIRRYAREGKLPVVQLGTGKRMMFVRDEIIGYLKSSVYKIKPPIKKVIPNA